MWQSILHILFWSIISVMFFMQFGMQVLSSILNPQITAADRANFYLNSSKIEIERNAFSTSNENIKKKMQELMRKHAVVLDHPKLLKSKKVKRIKIELPKNIDKLKECKNEKDVKKYVKVVGNPVKLKTLDKTIVTTEMKFDISKIDLGGKTQKLSKENNALSVSAIEGYLIFGRSFFELDWMNTCRVSMLTGDAALITKNMDWTIIAPSMFTTIADKHITVSPWETYGLIKTQEAKPSKDLVFIPTTVGGLIAQKNDDGTYQVELTGSVFEKNKSYVGNFDEENSYTEFIETPMGKYIPDWDADVNHEQVKTVTTSINNYIHDQEVQEAISEIDPPQMAINFHRKNEYQFGKKNELSYKTCYYIRDVFTANGVKRIIDLIMPIYDQELSPEELASSSLDLTVSMDPK